MNTNIPKALKYLRAKKGITQADLAKALGVGKSTISMYEVGAREPDFEMLENIADYFNVDMMFLVRPNAAEEQKKAPPMMESENEKIDEIIRIASGLSSEDVEKLIAYAEGIRDAGK